jgi:hypothetical protein
MNGRSFSCEYVTPVRWTQIRPHYGTLDTYHLAADWLKDCTDVADWGGSLGFFGEVLPKSIPYTIVDGTAQSDHQVMADLLDYHVKSDGILLRHVLDHTRDWKRLLHNAMDASRKLVVVTFTPNSTTGSSYLIEKKSGWPIWRFNPLDIRAEMGDRLVKDETVATSHPERVYYLDRT